MSTVAEQVSPEVKKKIKSRADQPVWREYRKDQPPVEHVISEMDERECLKFLEIAGESKEYHARRADDYLEKHKTHSHSNRIFVRKERQLLRRLTELQSMTGVEINEPYEEKES